MLKRLTKSVIAAGADGLAHMAYGRERQTDKDSFYELVSVPPAGSGDDSLGLKNHPPDSPSSPDLVALHPPTF